MALVEELEQLQLSFLILKSESWLKGYVLFVYMSWKPSFNNDLVSVIHTVKFRYLEDQLGNVKSLFNISIAF